MKPSPGWAKEAPPVLSIFLVLAGLGCLALSAWLAQVDLPQLVEHRITAAHGTISEETFAWLRTTPFQGRCLGAGALLLALGGGLRFQRPAVRTFFTTLATWKIFRPAWVIPGVAGMAVLVHYFPTLASGYFRYDDFDFLVAAQSGSFWDTFWRPHGDHFLPLMRVLAFLAFQLFGVTAWPYNLWILLCMGGVLVTGILLLREWTVSRPGQLLFVALIVFWSPWAEMMTGYYILSMYLLIATLSLAAIRFYLRWLKGHKLADAVGAGGCLLLSPLADISGGYVLGACAVFLAVNFAVGDHEAGLRPWLARHKYLLGGLAVASTVSLACIFYDYGVLHPGVFLHMGGEEQRTIPQLVGDFVYLLDAGVLLSLMTPFVYARLPVTLLVALMIFALLLWLVFTIAAVRSAGKSRRGVMVAIFLVVLGAGLMVTLGRPTADTMVVRWAAKHVCPVYIWLCLLLAVSWDALWLKVPASRRLLFAELTLVAVGIFVAAQSAFGLLGMAVAFPPFGYPAEIRDAERRREAVAVLRHEIIGELAAGARGPTVVPTLDGSYIKAIYPSLFEYNLSNYLPFFSDLTGNLKFVRNPAMQPDFIGAVQTVPVLRDAVSDSFMKSLAGKSGLRAFYFREVPLRARNLPETPERQPQVDFVVKGGAIHAEPTGGVVIESSGATEILIREQPWDPEQAPHLRVAARRLDAHSRQETQVAVVFASELVHGDWRGTLALRATPGAIAEVDLRQAYAFSLSRQVANLRVVLIQPGRYLFQMAELTP
jgi:hypothetical protein